MRPLVKASLLAGIPFALITALGVSMLVQGQSEDGRSMLALGVMVSALAGASVVYQIERWSLARRSAVHFAIMAVTVLPALLLSGWFTLDSLGGYAVVIGLFLVTGAVLWMVMYLLSTRLGRSPRAHGGSSV